MIRTRIASPLLLSSAILSLKGAINEHSDCNYVCQRLTKVSPLPTVSFTLENHYSISEHLDDRRASSILPQSRIKSRSIIQTFVVNAYDYLSPPLKSKRIQKIARRSEHTWISLSHWLAVWRNFRNWLDFLGLARSVTVCPS